MYLKVFKFLVLSLNVCTYKMTNIWLIVLIFSCLRWKFDFMLYIALTKCLFTLISSKYIPNRFKILGFKSQCLHIQNDKYLAHCPNFQLFKVKIWFHVICCFNYVFLCMNKFKICIYLFCNAWFKFLMSEHQEWQIFGTLF